MAYDQACADYADRAITLGNQLGLPAVAIRAKFYADLSMVMRTGVGWESPPRTGVRRWAPRTLPNSPG